MMPNQEIITPRDIRDIKTLAIKALKNAKRVHDVLGAAGLQVVQKNQFGETALLGDVRCEEAIFEVLEAKRLPIRIISEEHGIFDIAPNPIYLGIADGMDGTSLYKAEWGKGRYATLFGVYANLDPVYGECIFSGVMEHATGVYYHAVLGEDAFMDFLKGPDLRMHRSRREVLHTSGITKLEDIRLLYHTREYNDVSRRTIGVLPDQFPSEWVACAAKSYVDIALGLADAEVEVTRKDNLEQMAIYRLMCAAGAAMIGLDGQSIGTKRCLSFGQQGSVPLITAATLELALALKDRMIRISI